MPNFEYQAIGGTGERVTGALAAASVAALSAELERRQLTPVSVSEVKDKRGGGGGVSKQKLADAYRQIADLLHAGVPLLRALTLLSRGRRSARLAAAFESLREHVGGGGELSEAMAMEPKLFPKVHVAMVRAGEKGGFLESVFAEMASFVQAEADLSGKVTGQLVYPAILVIGGGLVLGLIFGFFVPMFETMFERLDDLPLVSELVFGASDLVRSYGLFVLVALIAAVVAVVVLRKKPAVRRGIDVAKTMSPALGPLIRALAAARFCRLLGTMEKNGVPLITGMQIAKDAAGNVLMEEAIEDAVASVRAGETLSDPLRRSGLFGEDVVEMISIGESAGNVDAVLIDVAATIERRVDRLLTAVVKLIEPLLLVAIGLAIGSVAIAIILPMTQLTGTV